MALTKGGPKPGPKRNIKPTGKMMKNQNVEFEKPKTNKPLKGKRGGLKNVTMLKYYNCGKNGYFARNCTEPNKVFVTFTFTHTYVCSYILVVNSILGWIVDTRENKHVVRDKSRFVDYHWPFKRAHFVKLDYGKNKEVIGIGSYQIRLSIGRELLLHDVLHDTGIECNLLSV